MTTTAVFAALAAGAFVLLCIVTWYLVQTLVQARRTALALEQFLNATRPKVEEAAEKVASLLGRTDRLLESVEQGRGGAPGVSAMIGQALAGWRAGAQAISAIMAGIAAIVQTWSTISHARSSQSTEATAGGGSHE